MQRDPIIGTPISVRISSFPRSVSRPLLGLYLAFFLACIFFDKGLCHRKNKGTVAIGEATVP